MFTNAIAVMGLAVSFLAAPVTGSQDVAPRVPLVVDLVTVNGSGCPAGTAAVRVSSDNSSFQVEYESYRAVVGAGATLVDFRKNCQLNLAIHVPSGFTYAIVRADHHGYLQVEDGASATVRSSYYFQGSARPAALVHSFSGPRDDEWQVTDEVPLAFSPCGEQRNLNVNTELRVDAGTSDVRGTTSAISLESSDVSAGAIYHLSWKQCPPTTT